MPRKTNTPKTPSVVRFSQDRPAHAVRSFSASMTECSKVWSPGATIHPVGDLNQEVECRRCRRRLGLPDSWEPKPGGVTMEHLTEAASRAFPAARIQELARQPRFAWTPEAQ